METIRILLQCAAGNVSEQTRRHLLGQAAAGFKAGGAHGARVLAALIEDLVHSRSRCATWALEAAGQAEAAPELLAALRRIAWAGQRRSGPRGRFEPELAGETGFVGWSPETLRTVKALAARALRRLSPEADPPLAEEVAAPATQPPPEAAACDLCCRRPAAQRRQLYSARTVPSRPGEPPDYRELRLHPYAVCAWCAGRARRRLAVSLAALGLCGALAFWLPVSAARLPALALLALVGLAGLISARWLPLSAVLERKALRERQDPAALGEDPSFQIISEQVMMWPFIRPDPTDVPREATCDMCGQQVSYGEGYRLTAHQVAGFKPQAGQRKACLVCENCIGQFDANRQTARFECRAWWERGQKDPP